DKTKIYGVMPYVAPEVLGGKPYTQAADVYSFGMIMYFTATAGRQHFSDCAHDEDLALAICNGIRPEIDKLELPRCYIDLMKKCWDSNPDNRPNAESICSFFGNIFDHERKRSIKMFDNHRLNNMIDKVKIDESNEIDEILNFKEFPLPFKESMQ